MIEDEVGLRHLTDAVDRAIGLLNADRTALRQKMWWWRAAVIVLGVLCALSLIDSRSSHHAVDVFKRQRTEARTVQCGNDNATATKINRVGDSVRQILAIATPPNPARTAEQQARIDDFIRRADDALDAARVGARDCSPAGIARYYAHP